MISKIQFPKLFIFNVLITATVCFILLSGCNQKKLTKSPGIQVNSAQNDDKVYLEVDQMPEFPGGSLELRKFITSNVKYPVEAQKNKVQGRVFVSFVVGKDGTVRNAKIARGVDPYLDAESIRVVNSMPIWTPGKNKGKVVSVAYTIPINFLLH